MCGVVDGVWDADVYMGHSTIMFWVWLLIGGQLCAKPRKPLIRRRD